MRSDDESQVRAGEVAENKVVDLMDALERSVREARAARERQREERTMTTYGAHMRWCKDRALAELPDVGSALASMVSDVRKNPETDTPAVTMLLGTIGMSIAMENDTVKMRKFIEDFASD